MAISKNKIKNDQVSRKYSPSLNSAITGMHHQVRDEIESAFQENRAFPFYPRASLIEAMRADVLDITDELEQLQTEMYHEVADGDITIETRLRQDARLSTRVKHGLEYIHRIITQTDATNLSRRRFVLIQERRGAAALYQSEDAASVSHIGLGPAWLESPSIYCGLRVIDLLSEQLETGKEEGFAHFSELLVVEGEAIEEGISYTPELLHRKEALTSYFVSSIENQSSHLLEPVRDVRADRAIRPFSEREARRYYQLLDTRTEEGSLDFDIYAVVRAVEQLERRARGYKKSSDRTSLDRVIALLVAASGHDVHEARNRANISLERIFAPKEFDAPPATSFINTRIGKDHTFTFSLPKTVGKYVLRIYKPGVKNEVLLEQDIEYHELPLVLSPTTGEYTATFAATQTGSFDFLVFRTGKQRTSWLSNSGCSGRINVLPDVRGEIVLQIFTDIHGHTRAYWQDESGHPGLVYNEYGEVIRLGRFSDIQAHLDKMIARFNITTLYLLGVFTRGKNREDWAPGATSPSPFSPMSFREFESSLGGESEFDDLLEAAHKKGIKIILDIMPHLNRTSDAVPDEWKVRCYDELGQLVVRSSTDGRYGSWGDGMLLNYREFEIWRWLGDSIEFLIKKGVDGIRFDTAHAVPIMMKKNNFPFVYAASRSHEEMVKGTIIVNEKEYDHLITTGYYDSACRDLIACPIHTYLMRRIQKALHEKGKDSFLYIAECYWGRERYLARSGILPYNMALFKICESIVHGLSDVREIYHLYHDYFPRALPIGTEMVGILGNHDERRALNTFGKRGARAAVGLTCFLSNAVLDYEGSAEGESWKVFPDNIYVNWNKFEEASDRSIEAFYRELYAWHRSHFGAGYLTWADNNQVAAALRFCDKAVWIGVFNFSDSNQFARVHFDRSELPLDDNGFYRLVDPLYSPVTHSYVYYTGMELRNSTIDTVVNYTDRTKLLKLEKQNQTPEIRKAVLRDSLLRLQKLADSGAFDSSYAFRQCAESVKTFDDLRTFLADDVLTQLEPGTDLQGVIALGLKRAFYYLQKNHRIERAEMLSFIGRLAEQEDIQLSSLGSMLSEHNKRGPSVFISAEAEPFSKSGGLANVVFELPRELARRGEEVYVITPRYNHGSDYAVQKMRASSQKYRCVYAGENVSFYIEGTKYDVGVHICKVEGVTYYLLDHHEFFDGLYWGYTAEERLRKRIALARSSAEIILHFHLEPLFVFTNDAFAGVFNGIVRVDPHYAHHSELKRTALFHVIHNGGWQYFDAYGRYEQGKDLFSLFNLDFNRVGDFADPVNENTLNCMATGIRFADKSITVSPTYAKQLRIASDGLERVIDDVVGISNAIGSDFAQRAVQHLRKYEPAAQIYDSLRDNISANGQLLHRIEEQYPELLDGLWACDKVKNRKQKEILQRKRNKLLIQAEYGLEIDPDKKLAVMVHRVSDQKGFQLLLEASEGIVEGLGYQLIAGGPVMSGDQQSEDLGRGLAKLAEYYHGKASIKLGFLDVRILLLGADVFLMPSRHEPGGISQLEALACGCMVVARATGGLRDTIQPLQVSGSHVTGNGILFTDYSSDSFYDAMRRFAAFFDNADESRRYRARQNARNGAKYWDIPAKRYLDVMYEHKEIIRP